MNKFVIFIFFVLIFFILSPKISSEYLIHSLKYCAFSVLILLFSSRLFKNKISYFIAVLSLFILLFIPYFFTFFDTVFKPKQFYNTQFSVLCVALVLTLAGSKSKISAVFIAILSAVLPLIYLGYFSFALKPFNQPALFAMLETNKNEAFEYFMDNKNIWTYVSVVFVLTVSFLFVKFCKKAEFSFKNGKILTVFILIIAVFNSYKECWLLKEPFFIDEIKAQIRMQENYAKNAQKRMDLLKDSISSNDDGVFVLVIGESENKNFMSVYGYQKPTTPYLNRLKNSKNAIFFSEAHSNYTHTVPVLIYALSAKNQYENMDEDLAPTLIETAKAAGFSVYWLSNQVKFGACGENVSKISIPADEKIFTSDFDDKEKFDESLLEPLKSLNLAKKSLVVVHLLGSHGTYKKRYPKNYEKFGTSRLEAYENSIFYNDEILRRIIEISKNFKNFKALVYMSDHGENPVKASHDAANFVYGMCQIPFFIYFNDSLQNSDIYTRLNKNKDEFFTNDLLYNVMLSLMGIKTHINTKTNDISSEFYDNNKSRFLTLHGKIKILDAKKMDKK